MAKKQFKAVKDLEVKKSEHNFDFSPEVTDRLKAAGFIRHSCSGFIRYDASYCYSCRTQIEVL